MIFIFSTLLEPQERLIDSWLGYNAFLCYLIAVLLCLAEIVIATFALLQLVVAVTMEKVPPPQPKRLCKLRGKRVLHDLIAGQLHALGGLGEIFGGCR